MIEEDENQLFEVEAFVAKPSPGSIEVKWVGTYDRTVKDENELREEIEPDHYTRFESLLDRWPSCSLKDYCADSCIEHHDSYCMVCNDGGKLICCETCPCVVHPSCVQLNRISHRWRCAICRCQAPNVRFSEPPAAEMSEESNDDASNQANESDEYCTSDYDADSDLNYDDCYSSSDEEEWEGSLARSRGSKLEASRDAASVEKRYRKQSRVAKAALSRSGNTNGAKPVEKLIADGTVIGEFPSKRVAMLSLGLKTAGGLQLKDASYCVEYRGFFWRLKGSSALPNGHTTSRYLKNCRPVEKLCPKTGRMIKRYNSVAAASREVGISAPSISNICNGWKGHFTAGGYRWQFSNNVNQEKDDIVDDESHRPVKRAKQVHIANRKSVEQVDLCTGRVVTTFKSKTAAYIAFGNPTSRTVLSRSDFEAQGGYAFGYFWRPTGSNIAPPMKTPPKKRRTPRKSSEKRRKVKRRSEEVVGQSVEVYKKKKWKAGIVESFNASRKSHIIRYDHTGAEDELILADHKLRWDKWKQTEFGSVEEECPICFEEPMTNPAATFCGHIFCKECISSIIESRHCCPMCMYPLKGNKAKLTLKGTIAEDIPDAFRAVEQVCMKSGEVLRVFSSAAAASALIEGNNKRSAPSMIIKVCQGARGAPKSVVGFAWRFQGSNDKTQLIGDRAIDGKAVECVDATTGKVLGTYESVRSAAKETGCSRPVITGICRRERADPLCGGYFWRYKGDESQPWSPRQPPGLPIEQICLSTGKVLAKFPSAAKAMKKLAQSGEVAAQKWKDYTEKGYGITSDIGMVCRLERRSAHGYFWRYQGSSSKPWDYVEKAGKKVRRISTNTEKVLQEYSSAIDAYNEFEDNGGFTYSSLCRACRDGTEYHGYFWEYVD